MVATSLFLLRLQFLFLCRDLKVMSRPQKEPFIKTSCNFVYLQRPLLWLLLTDPRRNIGVMSRPRLYSVGVATSEWCRDMKILLLDTSFSLDHISFVATSFFCCLAHPSRNLFLQVTTSLAKVFNFFLKVDFGDVVTWK